MLASAPPPAAAAAAAAVELVRGRGGFELHAEPLAAEPQVGESGLARRHRPLAAVGAGRMPDVQDDRGGPSPTAATAAATAALPPPRPLLEDLPVRVEHEGQTLVAVGAVAGEGKAKEGFGEVEQVADDARVEHPGVQRVPVAQVPVAEHRLEDRQGPRPVRRVGRERGQDGPVLDGGHHELRIHRVKHVGVRVHPVLVAARGGGREGGRKGRQTDR